MQAAMHEPILEALRRGDAAQALAAANGAIAADPKDAQALELLAAAQQLSGDVHAALASIDRAIALQPDEANLHFLRAGLLLGSRDIDAAQAALARSIGLDPNLFGAYVMQAQLALGRNELDEAERLCRLAARIAPGDPELAAIEGMVALRRDDPARAQEILAPALQRDPDHPQLRYALGFTYMAQGHLAFAEQAFRGVLGRMGDERALRGLIADLLHQQGRPGEAAEEIAPLLADPAIATPGLRRVAGELELSAGRPERALPLLQDALAAQPQDRRILNAIMETWRRLGDSDRARAMLDALLATHPTIDHLWLARLAFEQVGGEAANAIATRWLAAVPDSLPALEARMAQYDRAGDSAAAQTLAERFPRRPPQVEEIQDQVEIALLAAGYLRTARAYIADVTEPHERAKAYGFLGAAFGMGFIVGPGLAGLFATISYTAPIWAAAFITPTPPMPSVSVMMAMKVKLGFFSRCWKSWLARAVSAPASRRNGSAEMLSASRYPSTACRCSESAASPLRPS